MKLPKKPKTRKDFFNQNKESDQLVDPKGENKAEKEKDLRYDIDNDQQDDVNESEEERKDVAI